jgi:hypothetical protein
MPHMPKFGFVDKCKGNEKVDIDAKAIVASVKGDVDVNIDGKGLYMPHMPKLGFSGKGKGEMLILILIP